MSLTISYEGPKSTERTDIQRLFGKRLRTLRKERKLSQEVLAAKAGCDISTLGRTERGEVSPTLRMADRLAAALGLTLVELFDLHEQRDTADIATRMKEQVHVLSAESDPHTMELASLVLADFIHHSRKVRST